MMKFRLLLAFGLLIIGLSSNALITSAQRGDFIIIDADATRDLSVLGSTEWEQLPLGIRFFVDRADYLKFYEMSTYNGPTIILPRIFLGLADENRYLHFTNYPGPAQVLPRIFIGSADTDKFYSFIYPIGLIEDNLPPEILNLAVNYQTPDIYIISWDTDEYADSTLQYGPQPYNFPNLITDPLYTYEHEFLLTELDQCTTYFFVVMSTDRSGNTATSEVQSFNSYCPSTPTNTSTPTPTSTETPTPTNTSMPTPTSTETPTPTNTSTPTPTSTETPTPTNTSTPTSTSTETPTPTNTSTHTPTSTETPTPTNTGTLTPTNTNTVTPTPTKTPTTTNSITPTPTDTSTTTPTYTDTNLPPTPTPTIYPTEVLYRVYLPFISLNKNLENLMEIK